MFNKTNIQQGDQYFSILRTIVTSPKKKFNPTHAKRHIAIITPPKNVKFVKEPSAKKVLHVVSAKHKSKEQKDENKAVKLKINVSFFPTDPNQSSTSGGFQLKSNKDEGLFYICAAI